MPKDRGEPQPRPGACRLRCGVRRAASVPVRRHGPRRRLERLVGLGSEAAAAAVLEVRSEEEDVLALIDSYWEARLGVDHSVLRGGGVHVVAAPLGANDAMSFRFDETCVVVVPADELESAQVALAGLDAQAAFTGATLRSLVGDHARVDGPSWHAYTDERTFLGAPDRTAVQVGGGDTSLRMFLEDNDVADWAESGFPRDPALADPEKTRFWVLREHGRVVAAGNLTEWRGAPADVGVLTSPGERGRGLAGRVVETMVAAALPAVGIVRYRALASNVGSLAVARRLGFQPYGQNYRARRTTR